MVTNSKIDLLWIKLAGDPAEYSMENRAFNYVSIISLVLLIGCLLLDVCIGQIPMCGIIILLIIIQAALYYLSRVKQLYRYCLIVYAACSYGALIVNYYYNSGVNGPTICLFFVTFQLLIAISRPRLYILWISLHMAVIMGLVLSEYFHPGWVPNTYASRADRFLDLEVTYMIAIFFILSITVYLRRYFDNQRRLTEENALAITEKNEHITGQNLLLEKVNLEKNKLFSIISHDLRSPIDSIRGYLELLSNHMLTDDEEKILHEELLMQTKYTSDLLLNILYWSKTQMQGVTAHLRPLQLKAIVEKSANIKIAIAAKKKVKLTYSIPKEIEVIADEDMLVIVLRNLINNAIKFTKQGGEIFIMVTKNTASEVQIGVKDTGIGIPKERQDDIFTFKTQSTFGTNNEKGIGMGLNLCKEFMDYQNGEISFESSPGNGTIFYITFAAERNYKAPAAKPPIFTGRQISLS